MTVESCFLVTEQISHVEADNRVWKTLKFDSVEFGYIALYLLLTARQSIPTPEDLFLISDYHRCRSPPFVPTSYKLIYRHDMMTHNRI